MKLTLKAGELAVALRDDVLTDAGGQGFSDGYASYAHHGEDEPTKLGEHYGLIVINAAQGTADLSYGYHAEELPKGTLLIES